MKLSKSSIGAASIGGLLLALVPATGAMAEDTPTTEELLAQCESADFCEFTPTSNELYVTEAEQVSPLSPNCDPDVVDFQANWSQTKGTTDSVGGSVTASAKVMEVFEVSVEANYSHAWTSTSTTGGFLTLHVPEGNIGYITKATAMNRVTGTYELHFSDRYYGHYYWYTAPVTIEGPDTTRPSSEVIQGHNKVMSADERAQFCG
ncbi:hypothetical protein [Cryobacterium sp. SO1]|uniref:hypothetical protein n=1 Tax=Cryobacterium sp. SO1 TaxID=1897061 RepID=UPI002109810B|nr:hypothetical protein [Cryobacterium sp. SO1]